jgi:hypothetical protein
VASKRTQQEIFNRGLSPANNHHHSKTWRDEKRRHKKRESNIEFASGWNVDIHSINDVIKPEAKP